MVSRLVFHSFTLFFSLDRFFSLTFLDPLTFCLPPPFKDSILLFICLVPIQSLRDIFPLLYRFPLLLILEF